MSDEAESLLEGKKTLTKVRQTVKKPSCSQRRIAGIYG